MPLICKQPECDYTRKHGLIAEMSTQFCPDCGRRLELVPANEVKIAQSVSRGRRVGAYLIDFGIALILEAIASAFGTVAALLLALFWLFRDINGASPGKAALDLVVQNRAGGPSTANQRIVRNLPFAIGALPLVVPVLGTAVAYPIQLFLLFVETVLVLSTGERLGDRFAGTRVGRRTSAPQYFTAGAS